MNIDELKENIYAIPTPESQWIKTMHSMELLTIQFRMWLTKADSEL